MIDIKSLKEKTTITDALLMLGVQIRHSVSGSFSISCPAHEDTHPSMVIMPANNYFECKSCGKKGDIIELVKLYRNCDFKEALVFLGAKEAQTPESTTQYVEPSKYLAYRGISPETAKKFGLTIENGVLNIPIPTGKKMRRINPKPDEARFIQTIGTSTCIFKAGEPLDEIVLAEGELDAIVTYQNTGRTVWTGTTGAGTFKDEWVKDFEGVTKIYLAQDNDAEGNKGAEKVADILGRERCYRVIPTYGKDWTEFFQLGGTEDEFNELINKAKLMTQPKDPITFNEIYSKQQGTKIQIYETGMKMLDTATGGLRTGFTYIVGGLEKSGKSSVIFGFINHWLSKGLQVGLINTEQQQIDFLTRITANWKRIGATSVTEALTNEWREKHNLYYAGIEDLRNKEEYLDFEKTLEKLKEFVENGVKIIVLDNISTYATNTESRKEYEIISSCLSRLITFAKANNVLILPVLHVKKGMEVKESPEHVLKFLQDNTPEKIFKESITIVRRPSTTDLYGGGLGQSQVGGVFLLWRPYQKFSDPVASSLATLIVDSITHGSVADIPIYFNGPAYSYSESDPTEEIQTEGDTIFV